MAINKPDDFVPTVEMVATHDPSKAYGSMLVGLCKCGGCDRWMVEPLSDYRPFPSYFRASFAAQARVAGWGINSYATKNVNGRDVPICVDCKKAGLGSFTCALCEQGQSSSEIHESFGGEPADHLCKSCYAKVPAKTWDEKCEVLEKSHRYDGR